MPRHSDLCQPPRRTLTRKIRLGAALVAGLLLILSGCAPTEPAEGALLNADGTAIYTDGTYLASFSHSLPDGWRPYLQIRVKAGLIDTICFDAVRTGGERLSSDESYSEQFRLTTGEALEPFLDSLTRGLLERQAFPVMIPGAGLDQRVGWAAEFGVLARTVLARATAGVAAPAEVPASGPYVQLDRPDELGWDARMAVMFLGPDPVTVWFDERREGPSGDVRIKSTDNAATEAYERVMSLTPASVVAELSTRFLETAAGGGATAPLDAVSGATATTNRFNLLASGILASRVIPALPGKLCAD